MADDVVRDIPEEMVEKATFWNERVGRVEPLREGHPLRWWYGPLKASSDPNQKWCHDCYGVVEESNGRRWCRLCKASQSLLGAAIEAKADAAARELAPAWVRYPVGISSIADLRALIGQVLSAALAGRQVVDLPDDAEHLQVVRSDRGFARLPALPTAYGGEVKVYESSAASAPHLWLLVTERNGAEAHAHLTVETAQQLVAQLLHTIAHHYQGAAGSGSGED